LPVKQRVLITGANGQVGKKIAKQFATSFDVIGFSSHALDIRVPALIDKVFDTVRPDIVINAAAYTKVDEAESNVLVANEINFHAVRHLCNAAQRHCSLVVHFSTDYVFDGLARRAYTEDDIPNPVNAYGLSKHAGDNHIIKNTNNYIIFRLAWVYDEDGINFPVKIIKAAMMKDQLKVVDDQFGTPSSADFISQTVYQCIKKRDINKKSKSSELFNLVPNGNTSWFEFAVYILKQAEFLGFKLRCRAENVIPVKSKHLSQPAKRPPRVLLDNRKIQLNHGIKFAPWQACADHFVKHMGQ
jgi:dTDP-4-dehydrorhamnose reductase